MTPDQMKGAHGTCPVVRIKADNEQGFTEINEHDFDKTKHELYEGAPESGEAKDPADMTKAELSAYLDSLNIEHNAKATKAELLALVPAA